MRKSPGLLVAVLVAIAACSPDGVAPPSAGSPRTGASGSAAGVAPRVNSAGAGPSAGRSGVAAPAVAGATAPAVTPPLTPPAGAPPSAAGGAGASGAPLAGAGAPPTTMQPAGSPTSGGSAPTMPGTPAGSAGTPTIPAVAGDCPDFVDGTIMFMGVGGIQVVAGSKAESATAPMVFYWHGTGSVAGEFAGMATAVQQGVVSEGGVLISFQSSSGQGNSACSGTFIFSTGDMDIADQFLACAVKNHNIDPRRVFTTGCSAGGLFAACMAAYRSSYIAAAAPNSGGWVFAQPWENDYTPALMTIHGGPGDVVGVSFPQTSATADAAFKERGGFVINCNHGGAHCGGGGLAPDIWKFFKAHPYGVDPHPWEGGLPADFSQQCMIYQ